MSRSRSRRPRHRPRSQVKMANHKLWNKFLLLSLCFYLFIICVSFIVCHVYSSKTPFGFESREAKNEMKREFEEQVETMKHEEGELPDRKYTDLDYQFGKRRSNNEDEEENDDDDDDELPDGIFQELEAVSTMIMMILYIKFLALVLIDLIGILVAVKQNVCGLITFMVFLGLGNFVFEVVFAMDVRGLWTGILRYFRLALAVAIFVITFAFIRSLKQWRRSSEYYQLKMEHEGLLTHQVEKEEEANTQVILD